MYLCRMKIQIDITKKVSDAISAKAVKLKLKRKPYIELLCERDAEPHPEPANKHRCPSKLWHKFSNHEKDFYNTLLLDTDDQSLIKHVGAPLIPKAQWKTYQHNMAVRAVWALNKK